MAFLPVHNEESTVGAVVTGLREHLADQRLVVPVVDDDSTDSSAARAALLSQERCTAPQIGRTGGVASGWVPNDCLGFQPIL